MLSAAFTFGLYIVGHFNADLANFDAVVRSRSAAWIGRALYYILPNLAPFDVKAAVVHGQPVSAAYVALTTGYGLLYASAMVTLAVLVFSRRDFK
jgi:Cu-processing system permease protein